MTTTENDAARRPRRKPRTYAQVRADEQAAWDALTAAEESKRLLQDKAEHETANAACAARDAALAEQVARLNAATATLLALALHIEQASLDEADDSDIDSDIEIEQDCAD